MGPRVRGDHSCFSPAYAYANRSTTQNGRQNWNLVEGYTDTAGLRRFEVRWSAAFHTADQSFSVSRVVFRVIDEHGLTFLPAVSGEAAPEDGI